MSRGRRKKKKQQELPRSPEVSPPSGEETSVEEPAAAPAGVRWYLVAGLILVLASALPYFRSIGGGFYYDDYMTFISADSDEGAVFNPAMDTLREAWSVRLLRKIPFLTYYMDYAIGGGKNPVNPLPFHITNLLLHVILVLSVWFAWLELSKRVGMKSPWPPTLAALLFGVHPMATEAVNYAAARPGTFVAIFTFLALARTLLAMRKPGWPRWTALGAAAVCLLGAALSKEIGLVIPAAVILVSLYITDFEHVRSFVRRFSVGARVAFVAVAVAFVALAALWIVHPKLEALRPTAISRMSETMRGRFTTKRITNEQYGIGKAFDYNPYNFTCTQMRTIWRITLLALVPWGRQNIDHPVTWNNGFFSPWYTPFAAAAYLALWAAALFLPSRLERRKRLPVIGLAVILVGYLPYMLIPGMQPLLEYRYLMALAGLMFILAWGLHVLLRDFQNRFGERGRQAVIAAQVVLVFAWWGGTYARNAAWVSPIALWQDSVNRTPTRLRTRNELALAYYNSRHIDPGYKDIALEMQREIIDEYPDYIRGLGNLGAFLAKIGSGEEAIPYLERVVWGAKVGPPQTYIKLAALYAKHGRPEDALRVWKVLSGKLKPPDDVLALAFQTQALVQLGQALMQQGKREEAASKWEEARAAGVRYLQLAQGSQDEGNTIKVCFYLATACYEAGEYEEAIRFLDAMPVARHQPSSQVQMAVLKGNALSGLERWEESRQAFEHALDILLAAQGVDQATLTQMASSSMKTAFNAKDTAAMKRIYEKVQAALPEDAVAKFKGSHAWMLNVKFGTTPEKDTNRND